MQEVNLNTAIHYMKAITAKGGTFSLTYFTYDRSRMEAKGVRNCTKAKLRAQAKSDQVKDANHKLFFYDYDEELPKVCWLPLIAFVDNLKIKL
jgi:hypothetical protein